MIVFQALKFKNIYIPITYVYQNLFTARNFREGLHLEMWADLDAN